MKNLTIEFKEGQKFTSIYDGEMTIKQINKDYYGKLSFLIFSKNEVVEREEFYSIAQLENKISDYAYKLES